MAARRLVKSQQIWGATERVWPNFSTNQFSVFLNTGNLVTNTGTSWPVAMAQSQILGPVLLPDNVSHVDLEFWGEITGVTTGGASATGGDIFVAVWGLPKSDDSIVHPIEDVSTIPATNAARESWASDGLCVIGHGRDADHSLSHGSGTAVQLGSWPWAGQTVAVGDRWHMNWSIGRLVSSPYLSTNGAVPGVVGDVNLSGYRKLWFRIGIQNPTMTASNPSAMSFTGAWLANMYEEG